MWLPTYYNTFQRKNKEQKSARSSFFGRFRGLKKLSGNLKFMRNRVSIPDVCGKILFFIEASGDRLRGGVCSLFCEGRPHENPSCFT